MAELLERLIFGHRRAVVGLFAVLTVLMGWSAASLRVDAGFSKLLPLEHEYMRTFVEHREAFGGANRVLIALVARDGDIFTPAFFETLRAVTDEVFFVPGVDRTQVYSLVTPNVRYTEVVEDGIAGGNVVPGDFAPTPEGFAEVRQNILKAGILGRLVANDFSGAIVSASLLEFDPTTGEALDYIDVARRLEERVRSPYAAAGGGTGGAIDVVVGSSPTTLDVHIIGFAKVIGDIADGASRVVAFFGITFVVTALLVYLFAQSAMLALIPLACSFVAVVWQLGLLSALGYGIDPMSILVPFLVFAIGVSHGVQMVSAVRAEVFTGADSVSAARASFRRLLLPGGIALASDTIGFITILAIGIRIIQEMAITASIGVAVIIATNLVLLPVLLSWVRYDAAYRRRTEARAARLEPVWAALSSLATRPRGAVVIGCAALLLAFGAWKGREVRIGDLHRGVPELRADSTYNVDSEVISSRFSIGVDLMSVIVETPAEGCIDHRVMTAIDDFTWHMRNVPGVQSALALPTVARTINAGWNEGSPKWKVLARNPQVLVQAVSYVPTSSGLLNTDCSVMPVMLFTADHKAETISRIVAEVKSYRDSHPETGVRYRLATGNVGVMAATNEEVAAAQFPILAYVFAAIITLCLVSFRSIRGTACVVLPLALVSLLAYALMAVLEIGLKVSTLPVVALGVGIGVDYGIYVFSRLNSLLDENRGDVRAAFEHTLRMTGSGVVFTGVTLAIGVATWIFAPLKFQADMGVLLTFMFLVNMLGAIVLLPALAAWLLPRRPASNSIPAP